MHSILPELSSKKKKEVPMKIKSIGNYYTLVFKNSELINRREALCKYIQAGQLKLVSNLWPSREILQEEVYRLYSV